MPATTERHDSWSDPPGHLSTHGPEAASVIQHAEWLLWNLFGSGYARRATRNLEESLRAYHGPGWSVECITRPPWLPPEE
jgi:hypothetical protein